MRQGPFTSENDFKAHLAMELRKEPLSVIVEYNTLNLYLNNIDEYNKLDYQYVAKNKFIVTDIAIDHNGTIYPIELKYTFFKTNSNVFGTSAKLNIKRFIEGIEIIKSINKINTGYCIFLYNEKEHINKKMQSLIDECERVDPDADNPHGYACLLKEIVRP